MSSPNEESPPQVPKLVIVSKPEPADEPAVSVADNAPLSQRAIPPALPESSIRYVLQSLMALTAIALLSPVLLMVAIAVKLTSPGPLFYAGIRTGKNQNLYTMYKFRTLGEGSERQIGGRLLTAQDDFYTPVGKFLKKSKLDEVPQLLNVLRGELNFAGPRPLRPVFLEGYLEKIPNYADRFRVAPGMTGLAQVRGGYFTSARNKLRFDQLYVQHRSLLLDAQLVCLTVLKVLNRWLTLGAFLLVLLLFVSFIPSGSLENLYIETLGVKVNPLHGVIAFGALWMLLRHAPKDRINLYRTPLNTPIAVFLLLALGSAFLSEAPLQAMRGAAYYLITGFIVTLAIINGTFTKSFVRSAISAVALTSLTISMVGILEVALAEYFTNAPQLSTGLGMSSIGISSTLGSPIALSTYLLLGVPCVLCSLSRAQSRSSRDFWIAATTLVMVGVLLTKNPAGLAALSLIVTVYVWRHFTPLAGVVALVILAPASFLAVDHRIASEGFSAGSMICGSAQEACAQLGELSWKELLFGMGPRTLGELTMPGLGANQTLTGGANANVRLILENGVLGWAAMMWIFGAALYSLYRTQSRVNDPGLRSVLWAVILAILGFLVAMQTFDPFNNIALQILFWGLLGIGIGTEVRLSGRSSEYRIALKLGQP
jgi:lipopolysaccharide/colanic/teichoic acid biosynthesis glycosyltransferase